MAQYYVYKKGSDKFRNGIRGGYYVTDIVLTATGFSGAENTDWKCIDKVLIPINYWTNSGLFLFLGEVSKITGGKLYNQVTGATDYLTVAGSAGSETYQVPNNPTYVAADTDYIWFKRTTVQRTVTSSELVSYDYKTTFIKYDDSTPYSIREIGILKSGVTLTTGELNLVIDYFNLSVWWGGTLNIYGNVKGNRGAYQNDWTIPYILRDGNNLGTYFYEDLTTITKNGSNQVSQWNDYIGDGYNLTQSVDAKKMVYDAVNGLRVAYGGFSLKSSVFALNAPWTMYFVFKSDYWGSNQRLFSGQTAGDIDLKQYSASPKIQFGTAGFYSGYSDMSLNNWHIIRININVAAEDSELQIDSGAVNLYHLPNGISINGLVLGAFYNETLSVPGWHKAFIWRKNKDSAEQTAEVCMMLKERYGL